MSKSRQQKVGMFYALAAFGFWRLVPVIYFKAVQHVRQLRGGTIDILGLGDYLRLPGGCVFLILPFGHYYFYS